LLTPFSVAEHNISHIVPINGPTYGSTVVTVYGTYFFDSSWLRCRFGTATERVLATWVSTTEVMCVTDPQSASRVEVEVTNNNQGGRHCG
jgi:hypothetical protein